MADPVQLGLMGASTLMSAAGQYGAGKTDAAQLKQNARARMATGAAEASEERRAGDIMISNARAAMAAGGGTASDASALRAQAKIAEDADYNSLVALYDARVDSSAMRAKAKNIRSQSKMKTLSTILGGSAKLYDSAGGKKGISKWWERSQK